MSTLDNNPGCRHPAEWLHLRELVRQGLLKDIDPFMRKTPCVGKAPIPEDRSPFVSTHRILNLFDERPYMPTLADDLGSFTQVFIVMVFRRRIRLYGPSLQFCAHEDVSSARDRWVDDCFPPAISLYCKLLEVKPTALREYRLSQEADMRTMVAIDHKRGLETGHGFFFFLESLGKSLCSLIRVSWELGERNRLPGEKGLLREGDPLKAASEYEEYMRVFEGLGEDFDTFRERQKCMDRDAFERSIMEWGADVVPEEEQSLTKRAPRDILV